ncbi:MAG: hypothetical protein IPM81_16935 [Saprospirales bacterium]|nr:hypothetical protein [Saprospirales bacterium]
MEQPLDQINAPEPRENEDVFGKILLWNLGIMLGYVTLSGLTGKSESVFLDLILMILQVAANLLLAIISFVQGKRNAGLGFLLSLFLVVIVGFGVCAGKITVLERT